MILFKRNKIHLHITSSRNRLRKKIIIPYYAPLETIQLLFETIFNISTNKRDVQIIKLPGGITWYIRTT